MHFPNFENYPKKRLEEIEARSFRKTKHDVVDLVQYYSGGLVQSRKAASIIIVAISLIAICGSIFFALYVATPSKPIPDYSNLGADTYRRQRIPPTQQVP